MQVSLLLLLIFAVLYSITAYILYRVQRMPAIEPWIPVPKERYYLYQTFWTIPWGMATALMLAGITHVLAVLGNPNAIDRVYDDALVITAIAWVVPSFVLMWLPETFVVPFVSQWPPWVDLVRLSVLAPIWQLVLAVLGVRKLYRAGWSRSVVTGVVFVALSFAAFLPVMR